MWYIVQPGDSLHKISKRSGISAGQIRQANLLRGNSIYIGQRLYIPGSSRQQEVFYTVRSGDSLFSIAQRYNTIPESIISLNNLTTSSLTIGQRLQIPLYTEVVVNADSTDIRRFPNAGSDVIVRVVRGARLPVTSSTQGWYKVRLYNGTDGWVALDSVSLQAYGGDKPISAIVGFYTLAEGPALPGSFTSFANNTSLLSVVALFMYRISAANPTQIEKFGTFTDRDVNTLVAIAHRNNVKILPVVHNLLYKPGGTALAKDVVRTLVSDSRNRAAFIQNLIRLIEQYNFDGANIDIEDAYFEDSAGISALYTEMGEAFRQRGYFLSASVPSRTSDQPTSVFSAPFDYAAIGSAVDQFIAMLYNEHGWPGSGPGPVVSIGWMERVLRYTISKMPKEKVVGAVSVFGFDFNLTTDTNTYVTYQMAVDLAEKYNKEIIFDQATKTPMFSYTDEQGNNHEVWFEDRDSIYAKVQLAWQLGVSGIALWRLGMEDPAIWTMLQDDVVVRKL